MSATRRRRASHTFHDSQCCILDLHGLVVLRFAGKFEWFTTWLLAADERGLLTKEAVRNPS
jgi:hypothetical protein